MAETENRRSFLCSGYRVIAEPHAQRVRLFFDTSEGTRLEVLLPGADFVRLVRQYADVAEAPPQMASWGRTLS